MAYEPDIGNPLDLPTEQDIEVLDGQPEPADTDTEIEEALDIASDEEIEAIDEEIERSVEAEAQPEPEPQPAESPELADLRARAERASQLEQAIATAAQEHQRQQMEEIRELDPEKYVESLEQQNQQYAQQNHQYTQQQHFNAAATATTQLEEGFRKTHDDYDDALEFARSERARLLRATHPDQSEEWVQGLIHRGDTMFALQKLNQGKDPAAEAYQYAVRMGYQPGRGQPASRQPTYQAPAPRQKPRMTSLSATAGRSSGGRGTKVTKTDLANLNIDNPAERELFDRVTGNEVTARQVEEQGYTYV